METADCNNTAAAVENVNLEICKKNILLSFFAFWSGKNVWIHDCTVWDQDDCIAVKVEQVYSFSNTLKNLEFRFSDTNANNLVNHRV